MFSKLTFICNIGFILFITLRYVDINNKNVNAEDSISPLPFITGSLVILGQLAIFVNIVFCVIVILLMLSKKMKQIPRWLVVANLMMLIVQFYYFFIY